MREPPLAITAKHELLAAIERVAAAAGVPIDHADTVTATGPWRRAPLILLDADQVGAAASSRMPRRDGVVVLTDHDLDAGQWASCLSIGAHRVLGMGSADDELVRLLADAADAGTSGPGDGRVIGMVGACGGAGATVLAVATAFAAVRSGRGVVLADADPWGPGVDVVLGREAADGARWDDIAAPSGRLPPDALHRALPSVPAGRGSLAMLARPRDPGRPLDPDVLDTVLDAACRAGDVTVVDLPRTPTPAGDRAVARADLTVLVVPADVRGCYAAARVTPRLAELGARLGVVVRGPSPGGLGAGDIAGTLELPLLAGMRPEPGLERRLDGGDPPGTSPKGPLGRAAAAVLERVGVTV